MTLRLIYPHGASAACLHQLTSQTEKNADDYKRNVQPSSRLCCRGSEAHHLWWSRTRESDDPSLSFTQKLLLLQFSKDITAQRWGGERRAPKKQLLLPLVWGNITPGDVMGLDMKQREGTCVEKALNLLCDINLKSVYFRSLICSSFVPHNHWFIHHRSC